MEIWKVSDTVTIGETFKSPEELTKYIVAVKGKLMA
jgi:hypothetical protein